MKKSINKAVIFLLCALLTLTLPAQVVFAEDTAIPGEGNLSLGTSEEIALPAAAPRANTPPTLTENGRRTKSGTASPDYHIDGWRSYEYANPVYQDFFDAENDTLTYFVASNSGEGHVYISFGHLYYSASINEGGKVVRIEVGANDGTANSTSNSVILITVLAPPPAEPAENQLPTPNIWAFEQDGELIWDSVLPEAEKDNPEWDCAYNINIFLETDDGEEEMIFSIYYDHSGGSQFIEAEVLGHCINESGNYRFEVTAVDLYDGRPEAKYLSSEPATLEYEYTRPTNELPVPQNLQWTEEGGDYYWQFDHIDDRTNQRDYYAKFNVNDSFYFSSLDSRTKVRLWFGIMTGKAYDFSVQSVSTDLELIANSPWSDRSPTLRPEEDIVEISAELHSLEAKLTNEEITVPEALEYIKGLDKSELKQAMQTDPALLGIIQNIEQLYILETGITASTTASDYVAERLAHGELSVVGAGLNSAGGNVALQFDQLKKEVTVDSIYMSYIQFSIELEGVEDSSDLAVPIRITMPLPNGLSPNRMVLMHYTNSLEYEYVDYVLNGDGTISFTVTHLSEFVFAIDENSPNSISFFDTDGWTMQKDRSEVTVLSGSETALNEGWYYVDKNLTYTTALNFSGEIHIIIADHCNITFAGSTGSFSRLQIYAQSTGSVGGKMALSSGTTWMISSGSGDIEIYPGATFTIEQGAELLFYGSNFKNWGTFEVAGYLYNKPLSALWNHGSLTISGTLENDCNLFGVGNDTMTIKNGGKLINNFSIISLGAIDVEAGGRVENNHTTTISEIGILTIKEGASFINNGTIERKGTIIGTVVNNRRPIIKPGMATQTVTLRPSSADGNIPAVVYAADVSRWFEDPDSDRLIYNLSDPGSGIIYSLENDILTLTASSATPAGNYFMDVFGKDEYIYSEPVKVEITVAAAPANPAPGATLHSLVVSTSDSTRGKVTGNSNGSYVEGATITVAAVPYDSRPFTGWTVSGVQVTTTDNPLSFIMPAGDVTLTASFGELYPVTMISGAQAGGGWYPQGGIVPIVAKAPPSGQRFKEWETTPPVTFTADTRKTSPSAKFIMPTEEVKVTATFEDIPPTTYSVNVPNGTGSGSYAEGATVTITANTPPSGQQFKSWTVSPAVTFTGGTSATSATAKFIMPAEAVTAAAVYEAIPPTTYPVTVTNGTGGGSYAENATVTITANAPPSGQRFKSWTVSPAVTFTGGTSATSPTAKFIMPAGAVTAAAVYEDIPPTTYPVTVTNGTGGGSFAENATVTITANAPPSGQRFKNWTVSPAVTFTGGTSATSATAKFTMSAGAVTATAVYEVIPATITPEQTPTAQIDYRNERLINLTSGNSYTFNGTVKAATGGAVSIEPAWIGTTIAVVKKGNGTTTSDSGVQSLTIPPRPGIPTGLGGLNTSAVGANDGKISGVTASMEYRAISATTWTTCTGTQIIGLATGNYQVRFKATSTAFCGTAINVVVASGSQQTRLLTLTAPVFDTVVAGYSQPGAKSVNIANSGNATATISSVTISGSAFQVSGAGSGVPSGGSINTWTVQPKAGLSAGTYSATITVGYDSGAVAATTVSFTVTPQTGIPQVNYTVTFDLAGGTHTGGGALTQAVPAGSGATAPTTTRGGYTFTGWDKEFVLVSAHTTVTAKWSYKSSGSTGGSSSSGRGGGGSSAGIRSGTTPATKPASFWLDKTNATKLVGTAKAGVKSYVGTKSMGTYGVHKEALTALAGIKYQHDTIANSVVQLRIYIDNPANLTKDVLVSGYTKGANVDKLRSAFGKWFSNKLVIIELDQQEDWEAPVNIAAKVDLSTIDNKNLHFYSYNAKLNNYRRIEKPEYWIDANGYLHFTTPFAGSIIVSEGQLKKK